jgi:Lectin C-type domain
MGYLRKHLHRAGLASTLLIGGVLGGLMAPLPSEAQTRPTVTLKVDSGTATSILTATGTCPLETGYTACYTINTNLTVVGVPPQGTTLPVRSYHVRPAPGATARLRVADLAGQDKLSLVGVQFIPTETTWGNATANTSETHVLTLTISNTFDSATTNIANAGNYVWAIRAGGEFRAGPTGAAGPNTCGAAACNTIGNSVTYPGIGTFSPSLTNRNILSPPGSTANTSPLSFTVAGPTNPIVSFNGLTNATLGQVNPTYPTFLCDADGPTSGTTGTGVVCKPSITQTMTVTLKGPDTFVLVNGGDGYGASCAATLTATQQKQISFLTKLVTFLTLWESRHHSPHLEAFIAKINAFLATVNTVDPNCGGATLVNLDIATAAALDQVAFAASGAEEGQPAPHQYVVVNHSNLNWDEARVEAKSLGESCDLATITSEAEQAIINVLLGSPNVFEGTIQDYWIGGSQPSGSYEPGGNWQWINGEGTFWNNGSTGMYANWGTNEPNNAGGSENHLTVDSRYGWGWNDLNTNGDNGTTKGYIAEGTGPVGTCQPGD